MEHKLKVLMVARSETLPRNLSEVFTRKSIILHHAHSGAGALVLSGNSLYDLMVLEDPLSDLPVDSVLSSLQSFEWASAGTPALIVADDREVDEISRRTAIQPARVLPRSATKEEIQRAVSALLGVPVRSSARMMINVEVKTDSTSTLRCFQSENISESGLMLRGAKAIPIGMAVRLEFRLPDEQEPVQGTAIVVRHSGDGETAGVGLRFVELEASEILRLRRFVDRTLAEAPPVAAGGAPGAAQRAPL